MYFYIRFEFAGCTNEAGTEINKWHDGFLYGMTLTVSAIFGIELFLSGIPMVAVYILAFLGAVGSVTAYYTIPHVQSRIDRFINPQAGDTFQVRTALEAVRNGGLFGRGPGEGHVKNILPDAHTDFIMAVAAEEYGVIICAAVVSAGAAVSGAAVGGAMDTVQNLENYEK